MDEKFSGTKLKYLRGLWLVLNKIYKLSYSGQRREITLGILMTQLPDRFYVYTTTARFHWWVGYVRLRNHREIWAPGGIGEECYTMTSSAYLTMYVHFRVPGPTSCVSTYIHQRLHSYTATVNHITLTYL